MVKKPAEGLTYYETQTLGRWFPRTSATPPRLNKHGREMRSDGAGPPVRDVTPVPDEFANYSLNQLREVKDLMRSMRPAQ